MSTKKSKKNKDPFKLDLGCGRNLQKGFTGVDIVGKPQTDAHIVHDLMSFPWPFKDNSIKEVHSSHYLEHIKHGDGYHDPFFQFFDELYRILKPGGLARFVVPYWSSVRAIQDPTHMRSIGEPTFFYLSQQWRKMNKLEHYPIKCNFDLVKVDHAISEEFVGRAQDAVAYQAMHNLNVVNDIMVTIKKAKLTNKTK